MTPPRVGGLGGNVPLTPLVKMSLKTMRPSDETVPRYPLNLPQLLPFPKKYPCSSHPPPPQHQAGYHPSRLPKDPAPVAAPCVSPPLGQYWPPAQTLVLGPRTSLPTKTYFPNSSSLSQHLRSCPHAVSPCSLSIPSVLSHGRFQPHHSSKTALTKRPKLSLCCQNQWPLFRLILLGHSLACSSVDQ